MQSNTVNTTIPIMFIYHNYRTRQIIRRQVVRQKNIVFATILEERQRSVNDSVIIIPNEYSLYPISMSKKKITR